MGWDNSKGVIVMDKEWWRKAKRVSVLVLFVLLDNPSQQLSSRIDSCIAEYYRRFQDVASFKRKACKM